MYANHVQWLKRVQERLEAREGSLASLVVRWGEVDVAERVLSDQELLDYRSPLLMQRAFQLAVGRACSDPLFNHELIALLRRYGCNLSDLDLAKIFDHGSADPFGLNADMRDRRDFLVQNPGKLTNYEGIIDEATEDDKMQKIELLDHGYPVAPGSPWREEHVYVLEKYIGNFRACVHVPVRGPARSQRA